MFPSCLRISRTRRALMHRLLEYVDTTQTSIREMEILANHFKDFAERFKVTSL